MLLAGAAAERGARVGVEAVVGQQRPPEDVAEGAAGGGAVALEDGVEDEGGGAAGGVAGVAVEGPADLGHVIHEGAVRDPRAGVPAAAPEAVDAPGARGAVAGDEDVGEPGARDAAASEVVDGAAVEGGRVALDADAFEPGARGTFETIEVECPSGLLGAVGEEGAVLEHRIGRAAGVGVEVEGPTAVARVVPSEGHVAEADRCATPEADVRLDGPTEEAAVALEARPRHREGGLAADGQEAEGPAVAVARVIVPEVDVREARRDVTAVARREVEPGAALELGAVLAKAAPHDGHFRRAAVVGADVSSGPTGARVVVGEVAPLEREPRVAPALGVDEEGRPEALGVGALEAAAPNREGGAVAALRDDHVELPTRDPRIGEAAARRVGASADEGEPLEQRPGRRRDRRHNRETGRRVGARTDAAREDRRARGAGALDESGLRAGEAPPHPHPRMEPEGGRAVGERTGHTGCGGVGAGGDPDLVPGRGRVEYGGEVACGGCPGTSVAGAAGADVGGTLRPRHEPEPEQREGVD